MSQRGDGSNHTRRRAMSGDKFQYVKDIPASMPDAAHRVLIAIWNHANEYGDNAFPGVNTIAAETGKSRPTVLRWLKWLRDNGWIVQERRGGRAGDGRTWSSVYSLGHGTIPGENAAEKASGANLDPDAREVTESRSALKLEANAVLSVAGAEWWSTHLEERGRELVHSGKYAHLLHDDVPF